MSDTYDLYSPFDLKKHMEKFINYLEVIIKTDGTVEYAVPSHQEKLTQIACEKLQICRKELEERCPKEYWFDYLKWLCMQSGCVAVWSGSCEYFDITTAQISVLRQMKMAGVYAGRIPALKEGVGVNEEIF